MQKLLVVHDIACASKVASSIILPTTTYHQIDTSLLPTVLLSTHTALLGVFRQNLTNEMIEILKHYAELKLKFDYVLTGYFYDKNQIDTFFQNRPLYNQLIVDPIMADNGKFYKGFDESFVTSMLTLCKKADLILPNMSEACLLSGCSYKENYEEVEVIEVLNKLKAIGINNCVITSCNCDNNLLIAAFIDNEFELITIKKIEQQFYGTGDFFAGLITSFLMNGYSKKQALQATITKIESSLDWLVKQNIDISNGLPIQLILNTGGINEK